MPLVLRRTEGYPDSAICSCWLQNMFWNYFYWEPIGIFNILTDKSFRKKAVFLVIFPVISVYYYYPHKQLLSAARMLLTRSRLVSRPGRVATHHSVSISSNRLELSSIELQCSSQCSPPPMTAAAPHSLMQLLFVHRCGLYFGSVSYFALSIRSNKMRGRK